MKKGDRYLNHLGEYCVIASNYKGIIKLRICGEKARTEPWKVEDFKKQSDKFFKVPYPTINRANIARHMLEYQLNMIGKTTNDTKKKENWFNEWTISDREFQYFERWAIPLLKKTFKINTNKAYEIFQWFNMQFGLNRK